MDSDMKLYKLIGSDGRPYMSAALGSLGGHRRQKGYGRLDCPSALWWIARGHYVRHRVFFADEATAIAAGYRPCATCMPEAYRRWKRKGDVECRKVVDGGPGGVPHSADDGRAWPQEAP